MLEQVMRDRSCSLKVKLTVKGLVSFGLIVLAVLLPQLVHLTSARRAASDGFRCIFPCCSQGACSA